MAAMARRKSEEGRMHTLMMFSVSLAGLAAWTFWRHARHWSSRQTRAAAGPRPCAEAESLHSTATEKVGPTLRAPHTNSLRCVPALRFAQSCNSVSSDGGHRICQSKPTTDATVVPGCRSSPAVLSCLTSQQRPPLRHHRETRT